MIDLSTIVGFEWDHGNERKSVDKHGISNREAETVFWNEPLMVAEDSRNSQNEARYNVLGRTNDNVLLHVTFTLRQNGTHIRIISARNMNRKERSIYGQA